MAGSEDRAESNAAAEALVYEDTALFLKYDSFAM